MRSYPDSMFLHKLKPPHSSRTTRTSTRKFKITSRTTMSKIQRGKSQGHNPMVQTLTTSAFYNNFGSPSRLETQQSSNNLLGASQAFQVNPFVSMSPRNSNKDQKLPSLNSVTMKDFYISGDFYGRKKVRFGEMMSITQGSMSKWRRKKKNSSRILVKIKTKNSEKKAL